MQYNSGQKKITTDISQKKKHKSQININYIKCKLRQQWDSLLYSSPCQQWKIL